MTTYDSKLFYDGLVEHGLLIPTGPLGAFGRGSVFEDVLQSVDTYILGTAAADGAERVAFAPVIDRAIVERAGYMDSFPTLCGAVQSFVGNERESRAISTRIAEGANWGDLLQQTDLVLNPAACYPFYPTCRGTVAGNGRHVTMLAWVFRQEPSLEPTRMRSFRVREFVRVGPPVQVIRWRDEWLERGLVILRSLRLQAESTAAADPFFGRGGRILAAGQLEQKLKFEVSVPIISSEQPTACCSFNYHQDKFGTAFGINLEDGQVAHSACLGFGLERLVMALFKAHGFAPATWPADVRRLLWS